MKKAEIFSVTLAYLLIIFVYSIFIYLGKLLIISVVSNTIILTLIILILLISFRIFKFNIKKKIKDQTIAWFLIFLSSLFLFIGEILYYFLFIFYQIKPNIEITNYFWTILYIPLIIFLFYFLKIFSVIFLAKKILVKFLSLFSITFIIYLIFISTFENFLYNSSFFIQSRIFLDGIIISFIFPLILIFIGGLFSRLWLIFFIGILFLIFGDIVLNYELYAGSYYAGSYVSFLFAIGYLTVIIGLNLVYKYFYREIS